jgi:hypothetical protein
MLVLFTVISFVVSGTADANVHSSSSLADTMLLCARLEDGTGDEPPRRSIDPEPVDCGLIDCWKCIGEACRGAGELRAANGSGVRAGWVEGCVKVDGAGVEACDADPELGAVPNRSVIDFAVD